jgi:hypothetical protein
MIEIGINLEKHMNFIMEIKNGTYVLKLQVSYVSCSKLSNIERPERRFQTKMFSFF